MPSLSIIEKLNRHGFLKKLWDEFTAFGSIGLNKAFNKAASEIFRRQILEKSPNAFSPKIRN